MGKATMPRKVVALTVEQKREIYFFKKKNPFSSFRQIAKFFTCKFNVPKLSHQRIQSICKDKGFENITHGLNRTRKRNETQMTFERELYDIVSKRLRHQQISCFNQTTFSSRFNYSKEFIQKYYEPVLQNTF